ncbi:bifunctional tRNA (5-methylaminomethyl-2-thiouridine)(34)-methyltransferase MnmD/FAD-dependent 5-carboxymethylaminomethyl-2-thiouridine(34) oxidoreductase MnmC [Kordiimonas laminariae]|uniref:bifunctional tRNA (5-methylaminomethyl-2-thiouridine)(34)-methyltransferase MnmD/FAD-dependent 5-carboxymethylaminomethyl-2-thiouridine(34) oxidoreductase MnmC n=1 Tax=Kordiimonas laminariae TaxID=2917717 RepID=UPI001FF48A5C|nr:bifunctional tRNA (5-methylaminomethyl-2-thiouridine)(34)-methyltransferase MnmD/FAD-dependent 5-carboxymethylaminomethyl-2-thiouridine(34) oxidoreductase MnmC [Kordiimonas laminariae]MCK0069710.1 bifunctional tRNA (5-methylaminomethyl-2-thiouridine)(34)-methyltransferase MnmD/FAD-dependent 5-carboxymethylaminomethyl-2-thiouridine(34) oxidoreductase MnmC [Kordiimonas laminariae]
MVKKLSEASLEWRGNAPMAPAFGDVYYSEEDGLSETDFVFLKGIGAPDVWMDTEHFVIAETGFGTGLNFLATYKAFLASGAKGRLTFISVEGYPLSEEALRKAHATFPELAEFSQALCAAWPAPSEGFHHRYFEDGKIELLLMFGDSAKCYSELDATVNGWFLDGFAPAKNPDMWSDDVFDQIARLSIPGTKFATFTAAGFVKRGLRDRGFIVDKTKGYGRKRERLVGIFDKHIQQIEPKRAHWMQATKPAPKGEIAIIGGGIAGSALASALQRKGRNVTLFKDASPTGSNVPAAIMAPAFQLGEQPAERFITSAFIHACSYPPYVAAFAENKGVKLVSKDTEERERLSQLANKLGWDKDWLKLEDEALVYPKSGSLSTKTALSSLTNDIRVITETVEHATKKDKWLLKTAKQTYEFDAVILATGPNTPAFDLVGDHLGLTAKAGQIEVVDQDNALPQTSTAFGGYVTAPITGAQTIGSTFEASTSLTSSDESTAAIFEKLKDNTGITFDPAPSTKPWKSLRATSPDYLPFIGPVPDWDAAKNLIEPLAKTSKAKIEGQIPYQEGLYVMTGFGSKGYQQAPLAAEYLAALICGDPVPMPIPVQERLHPIRYMVRQTIRGKKV